MKRFLKISVSVALIGLLLWQLDWQEFAEQLRNVDPLLISTAIVLLVLQFPLSAWKWQAALAVNSLNFQFGYLQKVLMIAFFFNNFLPSAIGGDAYRAWRTAEAGQPKLPPIAAVLLERLMGLVALVSVGILCACVLIYQGRLLDPEIILAGVILAVAGTVTLWVAWRTGSLDWLGKKIGAVEKLKPLKDSISTMKRNPVAFAKLVALSFFFQAVAVTTIAFIFASLGVFNVLVESGFAATASGVAAVLPISVNGIGVVEGSFVLAALECSLPYAQSVAVALCLRLFIVSASIVCGLVYAFEPKVVKEIPTEQSV